MPATAIPTIATSVRPPRPSESYGTTWRSVESALSGYLHELRVTGQGIEPTSSRRTLEIALEDIDSLETKLALLRRLALENLSSL